MKKKWRIVLGLVTMCMIALASYFVFYYRSPDKSPIDGSDVLDGVDLSNFPEINEEFEYQGMQGISWSYYYEEDIYREVYDTEFIRELLAEAKNKGANALLVRATYNGNATGGLEGDEEEMMEVIGNFVDLAHEYEIKIFLVPYVESRDYWVDPHWVLDEEVWTAAVLRWAEFAEAHNVEMFTPGMEMSLILDEDLVGVWHKEILPQIRERYSGLVATAEHPYLDRWELLEEAGAYEDYDCIGHTFFLWTLYEEDEDPEPDMRSIEDYRKEAERQAVIIDNLAEKHNKTCKVSVTLGLDYWNSGISWEEEDAVPSEISAQAYDAGLEVLKDHNFTAVFVHEDALEPGEDGQTQDVKDMLKERWIK